MRWLVAALLANAANAAAVDFFSLQAVDGATGRGVPRVHWRTEYNEIIVTDNAGYASLPVLDMEGESVWFTITSDGYIAPADDFGFRGLRAKITAGGSVSVTLQRAQVGERIYRLTGVGLYRHSLRLGTQRMALSSSSFYLFASYLFALN